MPEHVQYDDVIGRMIEKMHEHGGQNFEIGWHPLPGTGVDLDTDDPPPGTPVRWYCTADNARGRKWSGEHIGIAGDAPLRAVVACARHMGLKVRVAIETPDGARVEL